LIIILFSLSEIFCLTVVIVQRGLCLFSTKLSAWKGLPLNEHRHDYSDVPRIALQGASVNK
jgi:hypothetical protein